MYTHTLPLSLSVCLSVCLSLSLPTWDVVKLTQTNPERCPCALDPNGILVVTLFVLQPHYIVWKPSSFDSFGPSRAIVFMGESKLCLVRKRPKSGSGKGPDKCVTWVPFGDALGLFYTTETGASK